MLDDSDARSRSLPSLGTKIAFIAALPFLFYGAYVLLAPITDIRTTAGAVFDCGSAITTPTDKFQQGVCQGINKHYLYKGVSFVAMAVGIAGLGAYFFGFKQAIERSAATESDTTGARRRLDDLNND
ncbi:MAG TPA: hypothetical protein PLQ19_05215 [Aeromicrobium sp.]|nr:hypothetical protein [Aeromicrobium sp.]